MGFLMNLNKILIISVLLSLLFTTAMALWIYLKPPVSKVIGECGGESETLKTHRTTYGEIPARPLELNAKQAFLYLVNDKTKSFTMFEKRMEELCITDFGHLQK